MDDLIGRTELLKWLEVSEFEHLSGEKCFESMMREIKNAPTIEPEVRHGRWIQSDALDYKDPNGVIHVHGMCSCCRLIYDFRDMTSRFDFCPNCGSKMDGGANNG